MITVKPFGATPDGHNICLYTVQAGVCSMTVCDLGASLIQLKVPDRHGNLKDVVLGYDSSDLYLRPENGYMGATIGRYAGRIASGAFYLQGRAYHLTANEGIHHLHGGKNGFSFRLFSVQETEHNGIRFSLFSPDGDEGYPGNLSFSVEYTLSETGALTIAYEAVSDRNTVVSFTNHSYFNLNGADSGKSVLNHTLAVNADYYCDLDRQKIPKGDMVWLYGGPLDFSVPVRLSARLGRPVQPLSSMDGLDFHFAFNGLRPNVTLYCPDTGIEMQMQSELPGAQIYTAQNLPAGIVGKGGVVYPRYAGICLEAQNYPNAPNVPSFPSSILRAGLPYSAKTVYRFSVRPASGRRAKA